MKAYFRDLVQNGENQISEEQLRSFKAALIIELKKQGATSADIDLVADALIINSINSKRTPEAVAWAILQ